jgi:hypothetical protein
MSDMLANENKIREEKKQAIDQASRDYAKELANYPTGQSESARAMALKFGDDASKYMLMQDKLLKSGQMKLGDYTVTRQNLLDDTDTAFNMLKDFQTRYGIKMDRYKKGDSQKWELEAMERIEGFGKFADSGMYIDPTTGKVTIAMKEKDPETGLMVMGKNPSQRASVPSVRGMLEGQWDKYNPNETLDMIKNSMGENVQTIRRIGKKNQQGEIMTVTDVLASTRKEVDINADIAAKEAQIKTLEGKTDKKSIAAKSQLQREIADAKSELDASKAIFNFKEFETKAIDMELENPWNRLSLMTDSMGKAPNGEMYHFVYTKEEADKDESAIYMEPSLDAGNSYQPKFTEKQKEASTEFMRNQLRGRYDYKEQRQTVSDYNIPPRVIQEWEAKSAEQKKLSGDMLTQWMKIYTAKTAADKDAAAENLLGSLRNMDLGVIDVDPTSTGVTIKYSDGRVLPIEYAQGGAGGAQYKSGEQWAAAGNILHGVADNNLYNKFKGSTFSNLSDTNEWNNVGAAYTMPTQTAPQGDSMGAYQKFVNFKMGSVDELFTKTEEEAVPNLIGIFKDSGFVFEQTGKGTNDVLVIAPDGETKKTFGLNEDDVAARSEQVAAFKEFLLNNATPQSANRWNASSGGGVGANYNPKPE